MKLRIHPITVETRDEELLLIQEQPGGAVMTITLSMDQVDAVCDMLFRARKSTWQEQEKEARETEEKTFEPFVKEGWGDKETEWSKP